MPKIILLHYTERSAVGGVNRWVNDIISGFGEENCQSYSWWDVCKDLKRDPNEQKITEWEKSTVLGLWLCARNKVSFDDIIIGDNWWTSNFGFSDKWKVISVAHGNFGHRTFDDIQRGVVSEFPQHEEQQRKYREQYLKISGRKLVAVSDFISYQMDKIWGFPSIVINNGINLDKFKPVRLKSKRLIQNQYPPRKLIIHFTTTDNKGKDHIDLLKKELDADVLLLDEAAEKLQIPKYEALAHADLVVHPSAHEGNSYAVLETLACDVPIISYNVGLMWKYWVDNYGNIEPSYMFKTNGKGIGYILNRKYRDPLLTLEVTKLALENIKNGVTFSPREWVQDYSLENFHKNWANYLEKEFGYKNGI